MRLRLNDAAFRKAASTLAELGPQGDNSPLAGDLKWISSVDQSCLVSFTNDVYNAAEEPLVTVVDGPASSDLVASFSAGEGFDTVGEFAGIEFDGWIEWNVDGTRRLVRLHCPAEHLRFSDIDDESTRTFLDQAVSFAHLIIASLNQQLADAEGAWSSVFSSPAAA